MTDHWVRWAYLGWLAPAKVTPYILHGVQPPRQRPTSIRAELWDRAGAMAEKAGWMDRSDIRWIRFIDAGYPPELLHLAKPPLGLFVRGTGGLATAKPVAVVGTRRMSHDGRFAAQLVASTLVNAGCTVLSGLAHGIDAVAHRAALEAGGMTWAVTASGVDHPGPPSNRTLANEVMEHGLLLSEAPPDVATTQRWHYPQRNRLVAALARAVVVVEAPLRSGALNTASHAAELGRSVWAVPGPLRAGSCQGSNVLLRDGAGFIGCADDLLGLLGLEAPTQHPPSDPVLRDLADGYTSARAISEHLGLDEAVIRRSLLDLELRGLVARNGDDRYRLRTQFGVQGTLEGIDHERE